MREDGRALDTSPEADAVQVAAYRRMTGRERTAVMYRLNHLARQAAAAGIRSRHPEYGEAEVLRALFRLLHGDALAHEVFPQEPLVDP